VKVSKVLANALDFEMRTSRDLRLKLMVREAAVRQLHSVRDENDALKMQVQHLEERIKALTEVA